MAVWKVVPEPRTERHSPSRLRRIPPVIAEAASEGYLPALTEMRALN
jgi:hypothetical protein